MYCVWEGLVFPSNGYTLEGYTLQGFCVQNI